jgi:DNA-binding XRE family transcriptional regulator
MPINPLSIEEAAGMFGGMKNLASILGVARKTLYNWKNSDEYHIDWCGRIEGKSNGHLIVERRIACVDVPDKY